MSASSPEGPLRKGWCPGALRPMMARDGLLVRLRITGGILSSAEARGVADLASRHGNGHFDLSARANLQMRGVQDAALPALWDGLRALDLLDPSADGESVRNVIASPLAGLHAGVDIRPLVTALEARLADDVALHALPTKFGFLVDDGGDPALADVLADVRFEWVATDEVFAIGLGGTADGALRLGVCAADNLVAVAAEIARGAIELFAGAPEARRMHALIASLGDAEVLRSIAPNHVVASEAEHPEFEHAAPGSLRRRLAMTASDIVGLHTFATQGTLGLAAPFGALDSVMLGEAADLAVSHGTGELRLTPWRTILVPLATDPATMPAGFITDPRDPRLTVDACIGREGCERGTTPTRDDAADLADFAAALDASLHVSGCEKGCAKASASSITLVGRDGCYDLVLDGRAGDAPIVRGLTLAGARHALHAIRPSAQRATRS